MVKLPSKLTGMLFLANTIALAKENDFDVVLIDTAGRMQDNEVSHRHGSIEEVLLIIFPSLSCERWRR